MASSEPQVPPEIPAAQVVGNAFVDQYYHMLHESPELVHRFYQDSSKLGRPEQNGIMGITTTMMDIDKKILSLGYNELRAEITSVDAQESYDGGVIVLVTGFMIRKDGIKQKFTQCFFLAPQEKGYFVLNDVFRYVDENGNKGPVHDVEPPVSLDNVEDPSVLEVQVSEKISVTAEDGDVEEVHIPENGQVSAEEEEAPVPEVLDEVPDDSQMVAGSQIEEVPKKSYASIVKVMKQGAPPSTVTAASVKSASKSQVQKTTAAPPPSSMSETNGSGINPNEGGNNQETEGEGYSIYVKGLPQSASPAVLENVFKNFGPIKSGGIQVRTHKGFSYGFVEFELASAVQSALEASPVVINGRSVSVEEKKSTNRGNSRARFSSGRAPSFRNDGARDRGSYGNGRNFGRGDFNGRGGDFNGRGGDFNGRGGDFNGRAGDGDLNGRGRAGDFNGRGEYGYRNGNRGGFSNRGGDGYQRDHVGNNGGRMTRPVGPTVNAAPYVTWTHIQVSVSGTDPSVGYIKHKKFGYGDTVLNLDTGTGTQQ